MFHFQASLPHNIPVSTANMKLSGIITLASITAAGPLRSAYLTKEDHPVPAGFTRESDAPASHPIRLSIGLKQSRFDELERQLYEISDPDSPRYGQYMTSAEVNDLVKPTNDTLAQVHGWLREHVDLSTAEYSPANDSLKFTLPVAAVETMLATKYGVYRHEDGSKLVQAPKWAIPQHLHEHITTVQPTTFFSHATPQMDKVRPVNNGPGRAVSPEDVGKSAVEKVS